MGWVVNHLLGLGALIDSLPRARGGGDALSRTYFVDVFKDTMLPVQRAVRLKRKLNNNNPNHSVASHRVKEALVLSTRLTSAIGFTLLSNMASYSNGLSTRIVWRALGDAL